MAFFSNPTRPASTTEQSKRRRFRPQLEVLEDRIAPAGTVVETAEDDGSAGSLREVIANAPNGSTITFDPNVFKQGTLISLDPTLGPIAITANNLTIDGGTSGVSINGQNVVRIFNILGGNLSETIKNMTLENGKASLNDPNGDNGGAILDTSQGSLSLTDDEFTNNSAAGSGGAIAANLGNNALTVDDCTFLRNTVVATGGAIATFGAQGTNAVVSDCDFAYNSAVSDGGAIEASSADGGHCKSRLAFSLRIPHKAMAGRSQAT